MLPEIKYKAKGEASLAIGGGGGGGPKEAAVVGGGSGVASKDSQR